MDRQLITAHSHIVYGKSKGSLATYISNKVYDMSAVQFVSWQGLKSNVFSQ